MTSPVPAEPPPEVTELWDRQGKRWRYHAEVEVWRDDDGNWLPWEDLLSRGPLSSVPPGTETEAGHGA